MGVFGCVCVRGALYSSVWARVHVCVYLGVSTHIHRPSGSLPSLVSSSLLPPVHLVLYMSGHAPFLWPSWFLFHSAHIVTGPPSPWSSFFPPSFPPPLGSAGFHCPLSFVCACSHLCAELVAYVFPSSHIYVFVGVFVGVYGDV